MDYEFKAPKKEEEEITLKDLMPGEFFIFRDDYLDECYVVKLVCDNGRGVYLPDDTDRNCLVLDLDDSLVSFEREDDPVVKVEPCEPITFRKEK
jgi:hypothetical protein